MAQFSLGFMWPDIADPYVYLKTLITDNNLVANWVGGIASSILSSISADLEQEHTKNALNFLQSVATAQQSHEMAFLRSQINELLKNGHGTIQESIVNELEAMMGTENFDYYKFIQTLNVAIQDIQRFKARLQQIAVDSNNKKIENSHQIDGQLHLVESLQASIGNFVQQRSQYNFSQEELIRTLTYKFFTTQVGQDFIAQNLVGEQAALNVSAAILVIQNQLAKYIYDNGILTYQKNLYKDEQEFLAELDRISQNFDQTINDIGAAAILSNQHILDEAIELYGLQINNKRMFDDEVAKKGRRTNKKIKDTITSIQKVVGNPLQESKSLTKILKYVNVTWSASRKISIQAELETIVASALSGVHVGSKNTGTDVLLGTLSADINAPPENDDIVLNTLKNIKLDMDEKKAANNAEKTSEIYLRQLDNLNNQLEGLNKAFIIHESTKLYSYLEQNGRWYNDKPGFGGRSMAILNYIDSIGQFGGQMGINTEWLKFAAYNLAGGALGSALKAPLETFFAIAAGLIMFDDFSVIAKEVTEDLHFSNVSAIHLYNLNGVYVPASYFLNATYNVMQQVGDALQNGDAFQATIKAPSVSYSRSMGGTMESRWETIKEQGSKSTVTLAFGANFLSLISQLLQ